jgi:hypothetical protein
MGTKTYTYGNFWLVSKSLFEEAIVKLFQANSIDELEFYWDPLDGDCSTEYYTIELFRITQRYGVNTKKVVFRDDSGWTTEGEERAKMFYSDLIKTINSLDPIAKIDNEDVWRLSLSDSKSLLTTQLENMDHVHDILKGTPDKGYYVFM